MTQEMFRCKKCKALQEGYRYCIGCGSHHENLEKVKVYTQEEVDELLKKHGKK